MTTRWIVGLASGSSADGVDAALLEIEGAGLELRPQLVHAIHQPYPPELRDLVLRVAAPGPCETRQVSLLHRLLGETFAAATRQVADRASFSLQRLQCIGCPGHTVWHDPEGRFPSTLTLGMAAVVAERTGVTTVSDFRARDVAAGGQGVPLAALVDHLLFRHPSEGRLLLHLGGLARAVYLPPRCRLPEVVGFEAAPCNVLLDALMRQVSGGREAFDPGGKHAVQGRCVEPLLQRWLAHPQLQRRPPRSLPRHSFGSAFAAEAVREAKGCGAGLYDLLCTATHFVAQCVAGAVRRFLPRAPRIDRVLLSGGGSRNGLLWALLEQALGGPALERTDAAGVPGDARKALGFGLLAALTVDGVPASVPSATGAVASRLLGSVTPGASANWARCLAWMAAQTAPLTRLDERD
jgi:anhydro-N-acetylmuramic acid kinase